MPPMPIGVVIFSVPLPIHWAPRAGGQPLEIRSLLRWRRPAQPAWLGPQPGGGHAALDASGIQGRKPQHAGLLDLVFV